ncbi:MAG: glycosyltransferase family 4 protein [Bacteroides sp.]|nr:glycosyltransferase family 4 protein [Bacteroides sp.]
MSKGYLFISNSSKPTIEQLENRTTIKLNFFSLPCIEAANAMGYKLYMGINRIRAEELTAENYDISFYESHTYRNIFALKDIWQAYRNACAYIKANPNIEVIHCNTPIGGFIGRLCGKKFGCKVIYTAHGFHFFLGAPFFYRIVLRNVEKWLAHYTDVLITINEEDYKAAQQFKLKKGGRIFKVPGVGVTTDRFISTKNKSQILQELSIPMGSFVCICMGDMVKRKNYLTAIQAIAKTHDLNIHYLICGVGPEMSKLKRLAKSLGIESQIHFLGFRKDIKELLSVSDIFLFSSLQEGLPRSTMEAMAAGLPCIVSDIRGNRDLIENGKGGYLIAPLDSDGFAKALIELKTNIVLCNKMSTWNYERIKEFDINIVRKRIKEIYFEVLK